MAFKVFAPGVLTSSDVNTFLMRQAVITCTSSTRPASPSEGMTIYETDTDAYAVYTGSDWFFPGQFVKYTPTFTGLTLGNGVADFAYSRVGDTIVLRANLIFGSTSSITATSGTIVFTLPVSAATTPSSVRSQANVGMGQLLDDSTGNRVPIVPRIGLSTQGEIVWTEVSGVVVYYNDFQTTSQPFTVQTDDEFRFTLTYEAA